MSRSEEGYRGESRSPSPAIGQLLGLHPIVAIMTIVIDIMLTSLDVTVVLWPVSCLVAAALVWPCYAMQKSAFGDDHDRALSKAIFVGILTAVPTPLPGFLTVGAGVVGAARLMFGGGIDSTKKLK